MSVVMRDNNSATRWQMNGFDPRTETDRFSYTRPNVLRSHFNSYKHTSGIEIAGYYTDWSQYDGRLQSQACADADCGRGVDMAIYTQGNAKTSYNKYILSFLGVSGDRGVKADVVARATTAIGKREHEVLPLDPWGDFHTTTNCITTKSLPESQYNTFNQDNVGGAFGGILELSRRNGCKFTFSIGGWTLSEPFHRTTADRDSRGTFVMSIVDLVKRRFAAAAGIDFDWEYPNAAGDDKNQFGPEDCDNYATTLGRLKEEGIITTICCPCAPEKIRAGGFDKLAELALGGVNLMAYDMFGYTFSDGELAHHANLGRIVNNKEWSVEAALGCLLTELKIDPKKLHLGVAGYTRNACNARITSFDPLRGTFSNTGNPVLGTFESGVVEWPDLLANYLDVQRDRIGGKNGFRLYWDSTAQAHYLYNKSSLVFMSIETPYTVYLKAKRAKELGLNGVFLWIIENDRGLLVNAIHEGLGHPVQAQAIDMKPYLDLKNYHETTEENDDDDDDDNGGGGNDTDGRGGKNKLSAVWIVALVVALVFLSVAMFGLGLLLTARPATEYRVGYAPLRDD